MTVQEILQLRRTWQLSLQAASKSTAVADAAFNAASGQTPEDFAACKDAVDDLAGVAAKLAALWAGPVVNPSAAPQQIKR